MASIAIMVGGAILNATAFVGGSYLGKYLAGGKVDTERIRHDKAIEQYQRDMGEWEEKRKQYQDWLGEQYANKKIAEKKLNDTDYAFKLYSKTHPDRKFNIKEPKFSNYYKPSSDQKKYEMLYVGGGAIALTYAALKFI